MEIGFRHLDELCLSLISKNTMEENLSHIIRSIEDEVSFQSLGIYLKPRNESHYQVKIHRHLSHHFVKEHLIAEDDKLIEELKNLKYIHCSDKKIKFEYEALDLIIFPIYFQNSFIGFIFIDKLDERFSNYEIAKLNIYVALLSFILKIDQLQLHIERINELDNVTGLLNHKSFIKNCKKNHTLMSRYKRDFSLCLLKINKLDEITQVIGNHKLPKFLQEIAEVIKSNIRETDFAGILYPDTFGIYYNEINKDTAKMVAERIHSSIIKNPRFIAVQFKWGINDNREQEIDFDTMFKQTEEALMESVRSSQSHICVYKKEEE
ncbi:MAG TPA: diguanylate cyclase [Candidatus Cloacimonadota bacterium]|nr:diguanylate cyclase [Candidatus Cloacimonadota bacterium]